MSGRGNLQIQSNGDDNDEMITGTIGTGTTSNTRKIYECVGNACRLVRQSAPEILGGLATIAPAIPAALSGDYTGVAGALVELSSKPYQLSEWTTDLEQFHRTMQQIQRLVSALEKQRYHRCSIDYLNRTLEYGLMKLKKWGDPESVTNRAQFGRWPEWYREELAKAVVQMEMALSYATLEASHMQLIMTEIWTTRDKQRKQKLQDLLNTCENVPSMRQAYINI